MAFKGILIFCIGIHLLEVSHHLYSPRKKKYNVEKWGERSQPLLDTKSHEELHQFSNHHELVLMLALEYSEKRKT